MKFLKLILLPAILVFSTSASAALIDLKAMGNGALGYGESAWSPLSLFTDFGIDAVINGEDGTGTVFAYLDAGNAGLGVCHALNAAGTAALNTKTGSGANLCLDSADDNVSTSILFGIEKLVITFNENVAISKLWFNNNHDDDGSLLDDTISIDGSGKTFGLTDIDGSRGGDFFDDTGWSFNTGDTLIISYVDEEFYLSAIDIRSVPEPFSLAILGLSMLGLGFARRQTV